MIAVYICVDCLLQTISEFIDFSVAAVQETCKVVRKFTRCVWCWRKQ